MKAEEITNKLNTIVIKNADIDKQDIRELEGIKFFDDLGYDSIGIVQLMCDIEDEFDISFDDSDIVMEAFESYDNLRKIVFRMVGVEFEERA